MESARYGRRANYGAEARGAAISVAVVTTTAVLLLSGLWSPVMGLAVDGKDIVNVFSSCSKCGGGQMDGATSVGRLFKAAGGFVEGKRSPLILCDIEGGGSTVRVVNSSGIHTIAGNLSDRGDADGPVDVALFNRPSSVVSVSGEIFVADTDNDCIKRISVDGMVSSFAAKEVIKPTDIRYHDDKGSPVLFISDTGNSRILYTQIDSSNNITAKLVGGFQPGVMQVSTRRNYLYVVKNTAWIAAVDLNSPSDSDGNKKSWDIANMSCLDYVDALMLTEDESELYYYGEPGGKGHIMSLELNSLTEGLLCPKSVMEWSLGPIASLVKVSKCEYYAVTATAVYMIQEECYEPSPPVPPDPSPEPSPSSRPLAVAAFRASSFPIGDGKHMHALYSWLMKDVGLAFDTQDFYAVFLAPGEVHVPGGTNVSQWTNLTTLMNVENTILITNYYGPQGMTRGRAQRRLFASSWNWTRTFLDDLSRQEEWGDLTPFCMVNCVDDCQYITFNESMCVGDVYFFECDDICVSGIISSVVLGAIAIVLLLLMMASSRNAKTAFVRLPALA